MLSRLVIVFLSMSKHRLISWLQSPSAVIFGAQENKVCHYFHCFPIYLPWSDGTRCHHLHFWMLNFKPTFPLTSFILIKRLFRSSSLHVTKGVVSSAYLRLLIFLPAILISACDSSSPAFRMTYYVHRLSKQSDSIKLCHFPFPVLNQSVVPCPVLTLTSWPTYRFLR